MPIRTLDARDAEDFVDLLTALDRETEYLMFEPGERPVDLGSLRGRLANRDSANGLLYALVDPAPGAGDAPSGPDAPDGPDEPTPRAADEPLTGFVGGQRRAGRRNRHVMHLVVAIRQSRVGRGHGRALLDAVEGFARREGVSRIELSVQVDNPRAIGLYERAGFEREGVQRRAALLRDGWRDAYAYAKLLDPA